MIQDTQANTYDLGPAPVVNKSDEKPEVPAPLRNDDLVNLESKNTRPPSKLKHKAGSAKQDEKGAKSTTTQDNNKSKVKAKILIGVSAFVLAFSIVADILIILILAKVIHYPFLSKPVK